MQMKSRIKKALLMTADLAAVGVWVAIIGFSVVIISFYMVITAPFHFYSDDNR